MIIEPAVDGDDIPNPNLQPSPETSGDEDLTVENSWQKTPLKGILAQHLPEKLGEVLTGLHMLLVSKIYRKIRKGKNIHCQFKVKGVLLDKGTANFVRKAPITTAGMEGVASIHTPTNSGPNQTADEEKKTSQRG